MSSQHYSPSAIIRNSKSSCFTLQQQNQQRQAHLQVIITLTLSVRHRLPPRGLSGDYNYDLTSTAVRSSYDRATIYVTSISLPNCVWAAALTTKRGWNKSIFIQIGFKKKWFYYFKFSVNFCYFKFT